MFARKLLIALCSCAFLISVESNAQTHTCASDHLNDSLLTHNFSFSRSFFYMEQQLAQREALPVEERTDDIYVLPVVVHVIHEGEAYGVGSNISDEQIFSAIEALNNDYRHMPGTNGDGDGVDVKIEFCLAQRDPNGQPTTGIVRVNGSSVALYADQGIEASGGVGAVEENVKALSTWPRASYVNIWVVNEIENNDGGSGVQGYAYFPVNNPIDGIVILHNAFGTVGTLKAYTDENRTITHEMGHYLGLYHTFHNTSNCNAEANCATAGDRVCDTPVTILASSCANPACSGTQQVENYMDYTSETCQDMFTEGQKLRMRTTLETQRTSMLSSLGCAPVFVRDAGVVAVLNPSGLNCYGALTPSITMTNYGSATLTSVTINYNVDGVGLTTQAWTGSLASGAQTTVTLGNITPATGDHTFYAWTSNPNGQADENTSNDQGTGAFGVSNGELLQLVVTLDYGGDENTWNVMDENNVILVSGGPYPAYQQGSQHTEDICLGAGCYTLNFFDSYGDGQGFTNGNYKLYDSEGAILVQDAGNWGDVSSHEFCIEEIIPVGQPPVASFTIQDNTVCKGAQVDFTSTSTNNPATYAWTFAGGSPATSSAQNPQNITWANSGSYTITLTVTNEFGTNTYTCTNCMTVYADPGVTLTPTNPTCSNTNGSILNTVTGVSPFTYSWSNGATTQNLTNVPAGSYTVTVTSAQGCAKQQTASITAPAPIVVTGTATQPLCNTGTGSISVSASGGTGNKTYSWSNGATGASVSGLVAGTYTVTATDANNCTGAQTFTITAPSAITINGTVTHVSCNGAANGAISVTATGGTGNKTFSWSNGGTGASISGLAPGTYTCTATDANNCTKVQSFTVNQPAALAANLNDFDIACNSTSGSAQVNPTGGTGAYTVAWSNGASGTSVNNLATGNYSVTVTDANNCSVSASFSITASENLSVFINATDISCAGAGDGSASAAVNGGDGDYTYVWSNGGSTASLNGLAAGEYGVIVTDGAGCQGSDQVLISEPAALTLAVFKQDISCFGLNDGSAVATANGGVQPYTYSWSNGAESSSLEDLSEGSYTISVIDNNGCVEDETIQIVEPSLMAANIIILSAETCAGNDGSAVVNVMGGSPGYFIVWSDGTAAQTLEEATSGSYFVSITDVNGCSIIADVEIPYECETEVAMTQLVDTDCGIINVPMNGMVTCDAVDNASMYMWRFMNGAGVIISDEYSLDNVFMISQIPGVQEGTTYAVGVKALVEGIYGPFGQICEITTAGQAAVIVPGLSPEDCESTIVDWGQSLAANEVPGAMNYQWHITGVDYDWTTYTDISVLTIEESMQMLAGEVYSVQIRCAMGGGEFTPWGPVCTFTVDLGIGIAAYPPIQGFLMIYPNPGNGENIFFDFSNLPASTTVEDLILYGSTGNLVEKLNITLTPESQKLTEYKFIHPLATGMYVLQYTFNGHVREQKLIVK